MEVSNKDNSLIKTEIANETNQTNYKKSYQIEKTEWWIIFEPGKKQIYYYNAISKNTSWTLPEKFALLYKDEIESIRKLTKTEMSNSNNNNNSIAANKKMPEQKCQKKSERIPQTDWWVIEDPASPQIYFYNASQNKTVWELPENVKQIYNYYVSKAKQQKMQMEEIQNAMRGKESQLNSKYQSKMDMARISKGSLQNLTTKTPIRINNTDNPLRNYGAIQGRYYNRSRKMSENKAYFQNLKKIMIPKKTKLDTNEYPIFSRNAYPFNKCPLSPHLDTNREAFLDHLNLVSHRNEYTAKHFESKPDSIQSNESANWKLNSLKLYEKVVELEAELCEEKSKAQRMSFEDKDEKKIEKEKKEKKEKSKKQLLTEVIAKIESASVAGLHNALSLTDLRQAALIKAFHSDKTSLEIIEDILDLFPARIKSSGTEHPTHIFSRIGCESSKYDEKRSYSCFFCAERFLTARLLEEHLEMHSSSFGITASESKCKFCEKKFASRLLQEIHSRVSHPRYMEFIDQAITKEVERLTNRTELCRNVGVDQTESNQKETLTLEGTNGNLYSAEQKKEQNRFLKETTGSENNSKEIETIVKKEISNTKQ